MPLTYVFERYEIKYILDQKQYEKIIQSIEPYVKKDLYFYSSICNIYYDTKNHDLIRYSIDKPLFKEKFRLRSYCIPKPEDTVFMELKRKYDGVVYKRRISVPYATAVKYLSTGIYDGEHTQIFHEIDYFMNFWKPEPSFFIATERSSFRGIEDDSLRITFDENMRSRREHLTLDAGDYGENLLAGNAVIMELKVSTAIPLWMIKILSDMHLFPKSFSKIGSAYTNYLNGIQKENMSDVYQFV